MVLELLIPCLGHGFKGSAEKNQCKATETFKPLKKLKGLKFLIPSSAFKSCMNRIYFLMSLKFPPNKGTGCPRQFDEPVLVSPPLALKFLNKWYFRRSGNSTREQSTKRIVSVEHGECGFNTVNQRPRLTGPTGTQGTDGKERTTWSEPSSDEHVFSW